MTPKPASLTANHPTQHETDRCSNSRSRSPNKKPQKSVSFQTNSGNHSLDVLSPSCHAESTQEKSKDQSHDPSPSRSQKQWKNPLSGHRKDKGNPLISWIFSRKSPQKKNSRTSDEEYPLLPLTDSTCNGTEYSATGNTTSTTAGIRIGKESQDPEMGTKKDYWKILKHRIQRGDLLLSAVNSDLGSAHDRATGNVEENKHEHEIQEAIDEIRKGMEFNLSHCLLAIFLYLAISVACFNTIFEPEWTILDSCYFAMVTVTTVGYGDEVPTSPASMIFTCIYACTGVAILGIALGILGSNLVDAQEAMASKAENLVKLQVLSVFDNSSSQIKTRQNLLDEDEGNNPSHDEDTIRRPSFFSSLLLCLKGFLPLAGFMLGMAYWIGHRAGWSLLEITYFMVVTATTVGYGDFTPKTDEEKMIALLFIPIAVGATGVWLGGVANIIVESRSARYRRNMGMKELTQHDLDIMDRNSDGIVSRAEFLEFMLVAMNKIDQTLVEELRQHFDRLDADGTGELTKDDLIQVARKKLQSPPHKLRLAVYKKHLMERSRSGLQRVENDWGGRFFGHQGLPPGTLSKYN